MRDDLLSIGEVARLKGVGVKALRYYERIGVLEPALVDDRTGYRYYALRQMPEIDVISFCVELGIPLKELRSYQREGGRLELRELLERGRRLAQERLRRTHASLLQIEGYQAHMEQQEGRGSAGDCVGRAGRPGAVGGDGCGGGADGASGGGIGGGAGAYVCEMAPCVAVALPWEGDAFEPKRYVRAVMALYDLVRRCGFVSSYPYGMARLPVAAAATAPGGRAATGADAARGGSAAGGSCAWHVVVEVRVPSADGMAAAPLAALPKDAAGVRLLSIPGGSYCGRRIVRDSFDQCFRAAFEQAVSLDPAMPLLASEIWDAELKPNRFVVELLAGAPAAR